MPQYVYHEAGAQSGVPIMLHLGPKMKYLEFSCFQLDSIDVCLGQTVPKGIFLFAPDKMVILIFSTEGRWATDMTYFDLKSEKISQNVSLPMPKDFYLKKTISISKIKQQ